MTQDINAYVAKSEHDEASLSPETNEVAPGRPAAHQNAVQLVGPWYRIGDGFSEHLRRIALALSRAGEKVHLQATNILFLGDGPDEGISEEVSKLALTDISTYRAAVYMSLYDPSRFRSVLSIPHNIGLSAQAAEHLRRQRIIYTVFERDSVPRSDAFVLSQAGQVWTACRDNADALVRAGVPPERVRVIPCPYLPDDPLLALRGRTRKAGPPRFYHIGKWEPRKAQDNIVRAFMLAFQPGEAQLILRCNPFRQPLENYVQDPLQAVTACLNEPECQANGWTASRIAEVRQSIKIIGSPLSLDKLVELHAMGDVYVTLSRNEGFDMPAFDAKLAGNRLIYTDTAARDFASPEDAFVRRTGTVAAHPIYGWENTATYGSYDIDDAVAAMRTCAKQVREGVTGILKDMSAWSAAEVGRRMRDALAEVGS